MTLARAIHMQRFITPMDWPGELLKIEDEAERAACEVYMRSIAARMRLISGFMKEAGCWTYAEWIAARREAQAAGAPSAVAWVRAGKPKKFNRG